MFTSWIEWIISHTKTNSVNEEWIELKDFGEIELERKIKKAAKVLVPTSESWEVYANALPLVREQYYHLIPNGHFFAMEQSESEPCHLESYFVVTIQNSPKRIIFQANMTEYQVQIVNVAWMSTMDENQITDKENKILKAARKRIGFDGYTDIQMQEL